MKLKEVNENVILEAYRTGSDSDKKLLEFIYTKEYFEDSTNDFKKIFEQFCKENNIDSAAFFKKFATSDDNGLAYEMLKVMIPIANVGWKGNPYNHNEKRWFPIFICNKDTGFGFSHSDYALTGTNANVGSRLSFETEKKSSDFAKKYLKIWEQVNVY